MSAPDPHIHVDVKLNADVAVRNITAATFGLVGDLPSRATTGCGIDVPYAMTSTEPASVTCLACREFAHGRYLQLAADVARLGITPPSAGVDISRQAAAAATQYRDLARRFTELPG